MPWNQDVVVETVEALLIESLEPPLNRRRGDSYSGVEYFQALDPRIERAKRQEALKRMQEAADVDY